MPVALLVETDPVLGGLMVAALDRAGFDVHVCEKSSWVRLALRSVEQVPNDELLLVLSEHVARSQGTALSSALRARYSAQATPLRTVFTLDVATPHPVPKLREIDVVATLEKPFELSELERLANRIRLSMSFTLFPEP
jgi:DNA-binding response OmpR family regulator